MELRRLILFIFRTGTTHAKHIVVYNVDLLKHTMM